MKYSVAARFESRQGIRAIVLGFLLCMQGCESLPDLSGVLSDSSSGGAGSLSSNVIADGLREALEVGAGRSVNLLGRSNGFAGSAYRIPLPQKLQEARKIAEPFGLAGSFDELEDRLNAAAEVAAPKAQKLFVGAIRQMSFDDVMSVYRGPDDAATQYLQRATSTQLNSEMRPIVDSSLADVGAANTYKSLVSQYNKLPFVKRVDADLSSHVVSYASTALFSQLAKEEAAIRNDPVKRSTELLRRVFAQ